LSNNFNYSCVFIDDNNNYLGYVQIYFFLLHCKQDSYKIVIFLVPILNKNKYLFDRC